METAMCSEKGIDSKTVLTIVNNKTVRAISK